MNVPVGVACIAALAAQHLMVVHDAGMADVAMAKGRLNADLSWGQRSPPSMSH